MADVTETVHVGGPVPVDLAKRLTTVAKANDRSVAAELRQAIRVHVEQAEKAA